MINTLSARWIVLTNWLHDNLMLSFENQANIMLSLENQGTYNAATTWTIVIDTEMLFWKISTVPEIQTDS